VAAAGSLKGLALGGGGALGAGGWNDAGNNI
jgi:hypothetical protein